MAYTNPVPSLPSDDSGKKIALNRSVFIENYDFHSSVYFAYIDVLGFKQAFDDNRKDPKKQFAEAYKDVFKYYGQLLRDANIVQAEFSTAGQTSDSLYYYTDRIDFVAEFIKIYLHFSLYAMSKDVFFRGGIANGCLFVDAPHQFYGDCVIKAYLLEEKISRFPRIALDQKTFSDLQEIDDVRDMLISDKNTGRFYLNPFVCVKESELVSITNLDNSQIQPIERGIILSNIEKGRDRFEFDDNNYQKYQYLYEKFRTFDESFEE